MTTMHYDKTSKLRQLLQDGCVVAVRTSGISMRPTLISGDTIIIQPTSWRDISPGEIIAFTSGEGVVAHRLIMVENRNGSIKLLTRGDAFYQDDPLISDDQVIGKVVCVIRQGRILAPQVKSKFRLQFNKTLTINHVLRWVQSIAPALMRYMR